MIHFPSPIKQQSDTNRAIEFICPLLATRTGPLWMFSILRKDFSQLHLADSFWRASQASDTRYLRTISDINAARKLYQPPPAQDLIALVKPIEVVGNVAVCDGGDPDLGHPRIYINLEEPGKNACGYCGQPFVKKSESGRTNSS